MATIGNTIKLTVEFKTFAGIPQDPEDLILQVFDDQYNQIGGNIPIDPSYKVSEGKYEYYYTVPPNLEPGQMLYLAFSGNLESTPITGRIVIPCEWA